MNLNKVFLIGRLTKSPDLRKTASGQSVCSVGIATNRQWTDKDGVKHEQVEFHPCVIWGKTAETASAFLEKGSLVLVEGRLETRSWEDKDGGTHKVTEIVAESVQFGPRSSPDKPGKPSTAQPVNHAEDDVPVINLDDEGEATGRSFRPAFEEEIPF